MIVHLSLITLSQEPRKVHELQQIRSQDGPQGRNGKIRKGVVTGQQIGTEIMELGTAHGVARRTSSQPRMSFHPPKLMRERAHGTKPCSGSALATDRHRLSTVPLCNRMRMSEHNCRDEGCVVCNASY
jgi:hypothetical protein